MKYRITISNYRKLIETFILAIIIGLSSILLFTALIAYDFLNIDGPTSFILFVLSILSGPIYILIRQRKTYSKEVIELGLDSLVSLKFGEIKYNQIKGYKILTDGLKEILVIRMHNKMKYGFSNAKIKANSIYQYSRFRDDFLLLLEKESKKLSVLNKPEIVHEKAHLNYIIRIMRIVIVIMCIIFIIHKIIS